MTFKEALLEGVEKGFYIRRASSPNLIFYWRIRKAREVRKGKVIEKSFNEIVGTYKGNQEFLIMFDREDREATDWEVL